MKPNNKNSENSKPKNFKKSMGRLFHDLGKFKILIVFAVTLAAISSVLSLCSPNLLRNLTDKISDGIKINTDNLALVTENIMNDKDNIENVIKEVLDIKINKDIFIKINNSNIPKEDIITFNDIIKNEDKTNMIKNIPLSIYNIILEDSTYKDELITKEDKIKLIELFKNTDALDNIEINNKKFILRTTASK